MWVGTLPSLKSPLISACLSLEFRLNQATNFPFYAPWLIDTNLLVLSEHFPGGKAHDAAPHRGEHPELEASEGDGRGAQARGHKQGGGDGHLAGVLRVITI